MRGQTPHIEELNALNHLKAHRVCASTPRALIDASLRLNAAMFPYEHTAVAGLEAAYRALIAGRNRVDDFEALDYYVYTLGPAPDSRVVAASGVYRLVQGSAEADDILEILRANPPSSLSFLWNQSHLIEEFVWGGRSCVEPASAGSPQVLPFVVLHIFSVAAQIVQASDCAPALLVFTRRHDNSSVLSFYQNLGFERTGASLVFAGEEQEILALDLRPDAPVFKRLQALTRRAVGSRRSCSAVYQG